MGLSQDFLDTMDKCRDSESSCKLSFRLVCVCVQACVISREGIHNIHPMVKGNIVTEKIQEFLYHCTVLLKHIPTNLEWHASVFGLSLSFVYAIWFVNQKLVHQPGDGKTGSMWRGPLRSMWRGCPVRCLWTNI